MAKKKKYYELIKELSISDFKVRYNSSILGYLWSLLNPLLLFAVLYFVFRILMRFDQEFYSIYLLLGIIIWGFLSECTSRGMTSMLERENLIKKIYFPRQIIVYATSATAIITFLINMLVFLVFFFIAGATISWTWILFPLYAVELIVFTLGLTFLLSSFFLKFRDLGHLWGIVLQLWFWLTPIVYPLSMVPEKYHLLFTLNPMARFITDSRNALIYHAYPALQHHVVSVVMVIVMFLIGYYVFRIRSPYFVDEL